jgi:hypothetical protein
MFEKPPPLSTLPVAVAASSWGGGGGGGAALETLGNAKAPPTIAVARISFSFIGTPLSPNSL